MVKYRHGPISKQAYCKSLSSDLCFFIYINVLSNVPTTNARLFPDFALFFVKLIISICQKQT